MHNTFFKKKFRVDKNTCAMITLTRKNNLVQSEITNKKFTNHKVLQSMGIHL
jgi:hypothetical protein